MYVTGNEGYDDDTLTRNGHAVSPHSTPRGLGRDRAEDNLNHPFIDAQQRQMNLQASRSSPTSRDGAGRAIHAAPLQRIPGPASFTPSMTGSDSQVGPCVCTFVEGFVVSGQETH